MRIFLHRSLLTLSQIKSNKINIQEVNLIFLEKPFSLIPRDDLNPLIHIILFV